jgi:hypothetical protein
MFFDNNGNQKKWLVVLGIFLPILLTLWGLKISINSADNSESIGKLATLVKNSKEQIDTLSYLIKSSQQQINYLQKIYIATDSTNKSTSSLRQLPTKLTHLGQTIDTLSYVLTKETKKLESSYSSLNKSYDLLMEQQKSYLDKISKVVELTNKQISDLENNNKIINTELTRRAKAEVTAYFKRVDNKYYIDKINVSNLGNIEFDIENLYISIMNLDFVAEDIKQQGDSVCLTQYRPKLFAFKLQCTPKRVNQGLSAEITFQSGCYFLSNNIDMTYRLTYTNKYENKTIDDRPKLVLR